MFYNVDHLRVVNLYASFILAGPILDVIHGIDLLRGTYR